MHTEIYTLNSHSHLKGANRIAENAKNEFSNQIDNLYPRVI